MYLGIVWTFAAFGEEIAYRGYLLTRAADVGGRSPLAWWIGVIIVSVLFGYGHYYKGPAGILDSGVAGLDPRCCIPDLRPQPLDHRTGARLHRYRGSRLPLLRVGRLVATSGHRPEIRRREAVMELLIRKPYPFL